MSDPLDTELLALQSPDPARRRQAAEWFSRHAYRGVTRAQAEALAVAAGDPDEPTRRCVLGALLALVQPQNGAIAEPIVAALARIGAPAAEAIVDELREWDTTRMARYLHFYEVKAEALARIGRPAVEPILRGLHTVRKPEARRVLIRALGRAGAAEAVPALLAIVVEGGAPGLEAAKSLQALGSSLGFLLRRVLGDPPQAGREDRRQALDALRRLAPPQVVPALLGAIQTRDRWRWERMVEALRALEAPELPAALLGCLVPPNPLKLPQIIRALKEVGSPAELDRACDLVTGWLDDPSDPALACAAADVLGYLGNQRALPALKRRAGFWSRPADLRHRARTAIAQIQALNQFSRRADR